MGSQPSSFRYKHSMLKTTQIKTDEIEKQIYGLRYKYDNRLINLIKIKYGKKKDEKKDSSTYNSVIEQYSAEELVQMYKEEAPMPRIMSRTSSMSSIFSASTFVSTIYEPSPKGRQTSIRGETHFSRKETRTMLKSQISQSEFVGSPTSYTTPSNKMALNPNLETSMKNMPFTELVEKLRQIQQYRQLSLLENFDQLNFDTLRFGCLTGGKPLVYIVYICMLKHNLFTKLNLQHELVINFLKELQKNYYENPYHNAIKAADTVHALHCIIKRGLKRHLTPEHILGAILAGACAYTQHPALDNEFQKKNNTPMAIFYNDQAVLQNHAAYFSWNLLHSDEEYNFLSEMRYEKKHIVHSVFIDMILALETSTWERTHAKLQNFIEKSAIISTPHIIRNVLQIAMIVASEARCTLKPLEQYFPWEKRLLQERFSQGDVEQKYGLEVTIGRDRSITKEDLIESQLYFIDNYLFPIFETLSIIAEKLATQKEMLEQKREFWKTTFVTKMNMELVDFKNFGYHQAEQFQKTVTDQFLRTRKPKHKYRIIETTQKKVQNTASEKLANHCKEIIEHHFLTKESKTVHNQQITYDDSSSILVLPIRSQAELKEKKKSLTTDDKVFSIVKLFDRLNHLNFDAILLKQLLDDEYLPIMMDTLFAKYNLYEELSLDRKRITEFFVLLTRSYPKNPHSNCTQVIDMLQYFNALIILSGLVNQLDPIDLFSAFTAIAIINVDHPGLDNHFQQNKRTKLSFLYNSQSILQNYQLYTAFKIIRNPTGTANIFENLSTKQVAYARSTIISIVLATDQANHSKIMYQFVDWIQQRSNPITYRALPDEFDFIKRLDMQELPHLQTGMFETKKEIKLQLCMFVKCSLYPHYVRPKYLYLDWCEKLQQEGYLQGDIERQNGLPVTAFKDRRYEKYLRQSEQSKFRHIIQPMFLLLKVIYPRVSVVLDLIQENFEFWNKHHKISKKYKQPSQRHLLIHEKSGPTVVGKVKKRKKKKVTHKKSSVVQSDQAKSSWKVSNEENEITGSLFSRHKSFKQEDALKSSTSWLGSLINKHRIQPEGTSSSALSLTEAMKEEQKKPSIDIPLQPRPAFASPTARQKLPGLK